MRRLVAAALTTAVLSPLGSTAEDFAIPGQPSAIRYRQQSIRLPSASGRRVELASGPVVYLAEDHSLPLVEMTLALRVGSFLDPPDRSGVAYLTGSQIRRGGGGGLDALRLDERIDDLGARLVTLSGDTRGGASLSVPSWALDEALDLFLELLARPAFQADRLATARSNLRESMTRRNEDALGVLEREWGWLMYGQRHFSTQPLTAADLTAIERRHLIEFHRRYWRPEAMILAVSGDFDAPTLLSRLDEGFGRWPTLPPATAGIDWPPAAPGESADPGLYHYEADVPQAKVMLGHRLSSRPAWRHPDRFALEVLAELLGGQGAISRIAGRLRTAEGLVYRASVRLDPGDLWPGAFQAFFEAKSASVARALELAVEEISRVGSEPIHPKELAVAKKALTARLRLAFDTAEEVAGYFAEDELLQRPHEYWQAYLDGVEGVTADRVQSVAQTYLRTTAMVYLVVGRWSEISARSPRGSSDLENLTGHSIVHLPARDPLSLAPVGADP